MAPRREGRASLRERLGTPFVPEAHLDARKIEDALITTFRALFPEGSTPPKLRSAVASALLGGGGRVRPGLCVAVCRSTDAGALDLAVEYAAAVEMVHAASLVHDDLPAFDDAALRRGAPTIHRAFGEPVAILVGDALLAGAFEALARTESVAPGRVAPAIALLARSVSAARGIIGGQALESEPRVDLDVYHRAKTAALFEGAACLGALAAGADPESFRPFGQRVGLAYQIADDLADVSGSVEAEKTAGRDAALGRPNAAHAVGRTMAIAKLERALGEARDVLPAGADGAPLAAWLDGLTTALRAR